ncbi:MAG: helix-turn-helix domain-containing protein [Pseudomonadota bacterium]
MSRMPGDDYDTAPMPPSVWDNDLDEGPLDDWLWQPPVDRQPSSDRVGQGGSEAAAWRAAEASLGRALAEAASAVARLDERLSVLSAERRAGALQHLALLDVADLVWAEGARLRPERLALVDLDRAGRTDDDAEVLGRAAWALRRWRAAPSPLDSEEAIAHCVGRRLVLEEARQRDLTDSADRRLLPLEADRAGEWLAAIAPLGDLHPLTRAGAGFSIWRRGQPDRVLEAAALASSLALAQALGAEPGALSFLPLGLGRPATRLGFGSSPEVQLSEWLAAVDASALAARRRLVALEAWRVRAVDVLKDRRGRGAAALADLFLARPILSAPIAAAATGLTAARTRDLLAAFQDAGLIRELTGHARFRYWRIDT